MKFKFRFEFLRQKPLIAAQGGIYIDQISIQSIDTNLEGTTYVPTITTSTTLTSTLISNDPSVVFYCSFDNSVSLGSVCGGLIYSFNNGAELSILNLDQTTINSLSVSVTDITSITGPTANKNFCRIPFTYNSREQYFCVSNVGRYRCDVSQNASTILDDCNRGNFLLVKTPTTGIPYEGALIFNKTIQIRQSGFYILSFSTFFNCPRAECLNADDSISVKIRDTSSQDFQVLFNNGSKYERYQDLRWIKEKIRFFAIKSDYLV